MISVVQKIHFIGNHFYFKRLFSEHRCKNRFSSRKGSTGISVMEILSSLVGILSQLMSALLGLYSAELVVRCSQLFQHHLKM